MLLTETYKNRLKELAGGNPVTNTSLLKEVSDLYKNSSKRIKFDINVMKQAIEGGMEVGLVFQSNNDKYMMPIWKTRIVQPVAMGYDKKGQLVVRGIHVEGQSEKKAIATGIRSAQAKNEWRLFKTSNIKSMFLTGRLFQNVSLPGYNPNDSAMTTVIASFNAPDAVSSQTKLRTVKQAPTKPITKQIIKPSEKPVEKPIAKTQAPKKSSGEEDTTDLEKKIDRLNKLI